jgi:hypothetical protein
MTGTSEVMTGEKERVIARSAATKQSRGGLHCALDCFAPLAMTEEIIHPRYRSAG